MQPKNIPFSKNQNDLRLLLDGLFKLISPGGKPTSVYSIDIYLPKGMTQFGQETRNA